MKYFIVTAFWALVTRTVNDEVYSHLGTKSPYRFNANVNVTVDENLQKCSTKVWGLIRHGTRYPSTSDIKKMNDRLPEIRDIIVEANSNESGPISDEILTQFKDWFPQVTNVDDQQILAAEGELENYEMSQRMQQRYPYTLPNIFYNETYSFRFTDSQRTKQSARYFAIGLFGEENIDDVYFPEPSDEDLPVLRFYELCSKWQTEINDNPETLREQELFEASSYVSEVVKKVNGAVGLSDELSYSDVQAIYKTCAFETAWSRNKTTPWCSPFSIDTIKVLEYIEDLDYYWVDGYGFELNYKQACPAFNDMIKFFEDEQTEKKALLYFSHSETVLKFIAHLGLYTDDVQLLHDNYESNDERHWKVSKIGSFGTNVAFVLHECDGVKSVSVLHNEHVVRLPACPDSDICSYEAIKTYFEESINCNFDAMCDNK